MKKGTRLILIVAAILCFAVALSYPILYGMQQKSNADDMDALSALRREGMAMEERAETTDLESTGTEPRAEETRAATAQPRSTEASALPDGQSEATEVLPRESATAAPTQTKAGEAAAAQAEAGEEAASEGPQEASAAEANALPEATIEALPTEAPAPSDASTQLPAAAEGAQRTEASANASRTTAPKELPESDEAGLPATAKPKTAQAASEAPAHVEATPQAEEAAPTFSPTVTPGLPAPTAEASATADISMMLNPTHPIFLAPTATPTPSPTPSPSPSPTATPKPTPVPTASPTPGPTVDLRDRTGVLPYPEKEKVEFDPEKMLLRYAAIRRINEDFIGWIVIPGTDVDYPVVQTEDSEFYLSHDFYGKENVNGQIILDPLCDPYTPSYNLVISGHNMRTGSMFGNLDDYSRRKYWETHKIVQFDTLMDERQYVVFAAFYSADYDVDEAGFRYNADIQYRIDADQWLADIRDNQLYDTEIDVGFGDEFLTLTTCDRSRRKDGRFVVVCRRIREGEMFE